MTTINGDVVIGGISGVVSRAAMLTSLMRGGGRFSQISKNIVVKNDYVVG